MRKEIEAKDKIISEFQKAAHKEHHYDADNEPILGVIEYTDTNKVTEKMFKETENLRREIDMQSQEISKYKEQKEELLKLNLVRIQLFRSSQNKSTN